MAQGTLAVNWCFTLNNWNDQEYQRLLEEPSYYTVIGKEKGKEETPHLQGYIQLKSKKRLTALKKVCARAHWEKIYLSRCRTMERG